MKGQPLSNPLQETSPLGLESFGAQLLSPSSFPSSFHGWGRSVFSHAACRLVVGPEVVRGRGAGCDGGDLWGGRPSSGEAADEDGAAATAECLGPGSGLAATASVTPPLPPHWTALARVGDPRHPASLSPPVPSLFSLISTPRPARARGAASGE